MLPQGSRKYKQGHSFKHEAMPCLNFYVQIPLCDARVGKPKFLLWEDMQKERPAAPSFRQDG